MLKNVHNPLLNTPMFQVHHSLIVPVGLATVIPMRGVKAKGVRAQV